MPVADTSIEAYHGAIKGSKEFHQDEIVFQAIKKYAPCTAQYVRQITGIELTSVVRSINNLHTGKFNKDVPRIIKDFKDICSITKFKAWHYSLPKPEVKTTETGQIEMFNLSQ